MPYKDKAKQRAAEKRSHQRHPETRRAIEGRYRERHKAELSAKRQTPEARAKQRVNQARYHARHPERRAAIWQRYYESHREQLLAYYKEKAQRPEVRERRRVSRRAPERRAVQNAWRRRPENRERLREGQRRYLASPEGQAVIRARNQKPEVRAAMRAAGRRYAKRHAEELRERQQQYRTKPETQAKIRAYREANAKVIEARRRAKPERRTYMRAYQHTEVAKAIHARSAHRRRARKLAVASPADLTAAQWEVIKAAYGYRCAYCGKKPQRLTKDHVNPIALGGALTADNVVPACLACNIKKHKRLIPVQPVLVLV